MSRTTPPTAKRVRDLNEARQLTLQASKIIGRLVDEGRCNPWYSDALHDINQLADQALTVEHKLTVLHAEEDGLRKGVGQP